MAEVVIKNPNELMKILSARISLALQMTQNAIYKIVQESLSEYYHEPVFNGSSIPQKYDRLYKMLNSIVKTDIVNTGNGFSCTVEVNRDYLGYTYPGGATGQKVWEWANDKTHGGNVKGNLKVWDNAIDRLGGEAGIINLMKQNLRKCGVPVA